MQQLTNRQLMILLYITDLHNGAQFDHMPNLFQNKAAVDALCKAKYVTCSYVEQSLQAKFNLIIKATKKGQDYVKSLIVPPHKSTI